MKWTHMESILEIYEKTQGKKFSPKLVGLSKKTIGVLPVLKRFNLVVKVSGRKYENYAFRHTVWVMTNDGLEYVKRVKETGKWNIRKMKK